ncbi:MAG: Yip1 family protein [Pseudomonadales bacterium]
MSDQSSLDLDATRRWVAGIVTDPEATAREYQQGQRPWLRTLMLITLPVYVGAALVGFVLSWLFNRPFMFGAMAGAPFWFLVSLVWSLAYVFVVAFIFDFFAGVFKGARNYDAAFATLSLAMVPAVLGGMFSPLPWIGWLIGLAASIYGLVLAWRFIPVFMTVPEDRRVGHFVVSLIVAFLVNMVVAGIIGFALAPSFSDFADPAATSTTPATGGMFGDLERQANVAEEAARDTYDPPGNGRLSEAQVTGYVRTLKRTAELRERLGKQLENLEQEGPSLGDIFSGVGDAMRLGTAEMEVVKTAGGNWAEHQWVKNQLEVARIQQDGSPAIEHNYALFLEYRDEIEQYE